MASPLDSLQAVQADLANRIDNFVRNTEKSGKEKLTVSFLTSRLELLRSYWHKFEANHDAILRCAEAPTSQYTVREVYDQVELLFSIRESELKDRMKPLEIAVVEERGLVPADSIKPEVRLPRLQLPTFDGDILRWEAFRDQFRASVHDVTSLSNVQRLQYLQSALSGEAADLLERVELTNNNYELAWRVLERRYANQRVLIAAHIRNLQKCPAITKASVDEYRRVLNVFRKSINALTALGRPVQHWDDWLVSTLSDKLDASTRILWETSLADPTSPPLFSEIEEYLENRMQAFRVASAADETTSKISTAKDSKVRKETTPSRGRATMAVRRQTESASKQKSTRTCTKCDGPHSLHACDAYWGLSSGQRKTFAVTKGLCLSCLRPDHPTDKCASKFCCLACRGKHHTSLHDEFTQTADVARPSASFHVRTSGVTLLATARVHLQSLKGCTISARALLDPGSELSFVSERVAQLLRLKRRPVNIPLTGLDGSHLGVARNETRVVLSSPRDPEFRQELEALVTRRISASTPSVPVDIEEWTHLRGLPLADEGFGVPSRVDVLLGADVCGFLLQENRPGPPGVPSLVRTPFGWVVLGRAAAASGMTSGSTGSFTVRREDDLDETLRRFWELEDVPSVSPPSPSEVRCEDHFLATHSRDETGRYVVRLPFVADPEGDVGVSRSTAVRMLLSSEKRRERDPLLGEKYSEFLQEYLKMGHMERVTHDCKTGTSYLPHHGVWKNGEERKKIRVVFNASYATSASPSLNSLLLAGPKLQNELWLVLLRWRLFRCAFSADIVKMFRQIRIDQRDTDWQRIVWRATSTEEVRDFRLTTVTYGTSPAPYLAHRVLLQLAVDEGLRFPQGAEVLRENSYVDDMLAGADNIQEAEEVRCQLRDLLMAGGFPLDKWALNCTHSCPESNENCKVLQVSETVGALVLRWDPSSDDLTVRVAIPDDTTSELCTKRSVRSETARFFDSVGWLAPVLVKAKILIQNLLHASLSWDEPLSWSKRLIYKVPMVRTCFDVSKHLWGMQLIEFDKPFSYLSLIRVYRLYSRLLLSLFLLFPRVILRRVYSSGVRTIRRFATTKKRKKKGFYLSRKS